MDSRYQWWDASTPEEFNNMGGANKQSGWTFTPEVAHTAYSFKADLSRYGGGYSLGTLTFKLYLADGGHLPTGGVLASATYDGDTLPIRPSHSLIEIVWGSNPELSVDTEYVVIVESPDSEGDLLYIWGETVTPNYTRGVILISFNDGVDFWVYDTIGWSFEEWGDPLGGTLVTTNAATDITDVSATLNGNITQIENAVTIRGFDYGISPALDMEVTESGSYSTGAYSLPVSSLTTGETYAFRAKVYDTVLGWQYGDTLYFDAEEPPTAEVETNPATGVAIASATLNADILDEGQGISERGFDYGVFPDLDQEVTETGTYTTGQYSLPIDVLTFDTRYAFRAKVYDDVEGWQYGEVMQFTTSPGNMINNFLVFQSYDASSPAVAAITWHIANDGTIEYIDYAGISSVVTAMWGKNVVGCHVAGNVWAVAYHFNVGVRRIQTFTVVGNGWIQKSSSNQAEIIDSTESIAFLGTLTQMIGIGGDRFMLTSFNSVTNGTEISIIEIDEEGTINPVEETLALGAPHGQMLSSLTQAGPGIYPASHKAATSSTTGESIDVRDDTPAIIDSEEYSTEQGSGCSPVHVKDDVYVYLLKESYVIKACTFTCDEDGVLSEDHIDELQMPENYYINRTPIFKISENVFGFFYRRGSPYSPYYYEMHTFEVNDDGTFGSVLNTVSTAYFQNPDFCSDVHNVTGDIYAFIAELDLPVPPNEPTHELRTYSISSDGLSVSAVDTADFINGSLFEMKRLQLYFPDRIYVWMGTEEEPILRELTDPDYPTVMSLRTERGRDEELGYAASGILEITCDNHDGDFSPENSAGAYYGELALGKVITAFEVYNGILYPLFQGKIDKIEPHPEMDDRVAYIVAIDGMDDLAGTEIETELRTDTNEAELVEDILVAAGWPSDKRNIDEGVDVLQVGWYHAYNALKGIQDLEDSTRGFFFVDPEGNAVWQNRHHRVTDEGVESQFTYDESMMKIGYQWSKRNVKNWAKVIGYAYLDPGSDEYIYFAPTNFAGAPYIPANRVMTIWGDLSGPRLTSDTLVAGTHWNANSAYDKSGIDLTSEIDLDITYYGQSIKFELTNNSDHGAYLVVPDTPPGGAPSNATLLIYGAIYDEVTMAVIEEDSQSQQDHGKRTITVDAKFKSNYNDVQAYAEYLIARYKDPLPSPIMIKINAWYNYPDDTMKIEVLTRGLSDRVSVISNHLGVNQDYYVDKIIHEYLLYEGGTVHEVTMHLSRTAGQAEDLYWLLGVDGFSELEETTILGF